MMLLSLIIIVSAILPAGSAVSASRLELHGLQMCPRTPLLAELECSITELNETKQHGGTRKDIPIRKSEPQGWTGPHKCAGDYCLYACRGFVAGRGIAVITTRENVQTLKTVEKKIQANAGNTFPPPFRVAEVDGKGLGLIANTTLARGNTVMAQTPVLLAHRNFIEQIPRDQQHVLLDAVPGLLPAATRRSFMRQMGHFGGHKVSDIMATNSFQMDIGGTDSHHYGNFPEVSRYNHDCRPNVAFFIGPDLVHRTTVVRAVKPGEELTISYLDPLEARAMRQDRARLAWGFDCGCSQCSLRDDLASQSDQRLVEIRELERQLMDFSFKVTSKMIDRFLKLHAEERLESKLAGTYTTAAMNYNLLGRKKEAVKYAKLAVEAGEIEYGAAAADIESMRGLAANPTKHFTWRGRLR